MHPPLGSVKFFPNDSGSKTRSQLDAWDARLRCPEPPPFLQLEPMNAGRSLVVLRL